MRDYPDQFEEFERSFENVKDPALRSALLADRTRDLHAKSEALTRRSCELINWSTRLLRETPK